VLGAREVEDALDRGEGRGGDLDEDGVPAGHRAVPEARALEDDELAPPLELGGDERGLGIDEAGELEGAALGVAQREREVDRVEVRRRREDGVLLGAVGDL
jgi:hypothetical protein